MELGNIPPWHSAPQVQTVNVLGDDELDLADLHQLGEGHVSGRGHGLVPVQTQVRPLAPPLQGPHAPGPAEVRDTRRGGDARPWGHGDLQTNFLVNILCPSVCLCVCAAHYALQSAALLKGSKSS